MHGPATLAVHQSSPLYIGSHMCVSNIATTNANKMDTRLASNLTLLAAGLFVLAEILGITVLCVHCDLPSTEAPCNAANMNQGALA